MNDKYKLKIILIYHKRLYELHILGMISIKQLFLLCRYKYNIKIYK